MYWLIQSGGDTEGVGHDESFLQIHTPKTSVNDAEETSVVQKGEQVGGGPDAALVQCTYNCPMGCDIGYVCGCYGCVCDEPVLCD